MRFDGVSSCQPDDWIMEDFSEPWVSDPEEDELASVALASERSVVDGYISRGSLKSLTSSEACKHIPVVVDGCTLPDSLRSPTSSNADIRIPVVVVSPYLQSLMNRYPKHVPRSLPRMRKRKTFCLFINYMGTRKKKTPTALAVTKRGTPVKSPHYPGDKVPLVPVKPQKVDKKQNETDGTRK